MWHYKLFFRHTQVSVWLFENTEIVSRYVISMLRDFISLFFVRVKVYDQNSTPTIIRIQSSLILVQGTVPGTVMEIKFY